jgi:hypothetical protein
MYYFKTCPKKSEFILIRENKDAKKQKKKPRKLNHSIGRTEDSNGINLLL